MENSNENPAGMFQSFGVLAACKHTHGQHILHFVGYFFEMNA